MPSLTSKHARRALWAALVWAMAAAPACGEDPATLPQYCEEEPPASYGPGYGVIKEPTNRNPDKIIYRWLCVDGDLVEETYIRAENGCWVEEPEYRRENLNCPQGDNGSGDDS